MPNPRAEAADQHSFMRALVAACALVASADGTIVVAERKRIFRLMRSIHVFDRFSAADVEAEFDHFERRFAYEPYSARDRALDVIEALEADRDQARLLLTACQEVLQADGVSREEEYRALSDIGRALGEP